jgi:hypothetical protein
VDVTRFIVMAPHVSALRDVLRPVEEENTATESPIDKDYPSLLL